MVLKIASSPQSLASLVKMCYGHNYGMKKYFQNLNLDPKYILIPLTLCKFSLKIYVSSAGVVLVKSKLFPPKVQI